MNRSEAIELMASRAHITREQAEAALTALLDGMDEMLKENGKATLADFEASVGTEKKPDESSAFKRTRRPNANQKDSKGSWDALRKLAGSIDGPPDWAENHDYYLHLARTASYGEEE